MNLKNSERGSALIFVMFFVVFLTMTIASVGHMIDERQATGLKAKILDSRNFVLTAALRNTRVAMYFYNTLILPAPGLDPVFVACMIGDDVTFGCNAGGPYPLDLIDETPSGTRVMGGDPSRPVYYNNYGQVCQTPIQGVCAFEVWATYNVTCPRSGSPCLQASTIDVTVFLRPIASVYPSNLLVPPTLTATQTIGISNYFEYVDAMLPPVSFVAGTPGIGNGQGAPVGSSGGPAGTYHTYVAPFSSTGLCVDSYSCSGPCTCVYTGAMGGGGGAAGGGPPPPAMASCPPGSQSVGGSCSAFNF